MKIILENIGKRFNNEWIFRNLNYEFSGSGKYAILGSNGSGKSTLLQIIAGSISESEGKIIYKTGGEKPIQSPFRDLGFAAHYLELFEEMTFQEAVRFHGKFKKFADSLKEADVIDISGLGTSKKKEVRNFSSGMKQRARLALAVLSDAPLLLLDEPCTNLDERGVKWYQELIEKFSKEKLVIVCSNYNKEEYPFCESELALTPLSSHAQE